MEIFNNDTPLLRLSEAQLETLKSQDNGFANLLKHIEYNHILLERPNSEVLKYLIEFLLDPRSFTSSKWTIDFISECDFWSLTNEIGNVLPDYYSIAYQMYNHIIRESKGRFSFRVAGNFVGHTSFYNLSEAQALLELMLKEEYICTYTSMVYPDRHYNEYNLIHFGFDIPLDIDIMSRLCSVGKIKDEPGIKKVKFDYRLVHKESLFCLGNMSKDSCPLEINFEV